MSVRHWVELDSAGLAAQAVPAAVAVLALGAVEQHGPHLPLGTDTCIADGLVDAALARCGSDLVVLRLPTLSIGQGIEHAGHVGTLALEPATFEALIYDLGASVARAGLRRLLAFSAHGGNLAALDSAALRLRRDFGLLVVKACYFDFPGLPETLPEREHREGLHGGALETALLMHLAPGAVNQARLGHFASIEFDALADGRWLGAENRPARFAWLAGDLNSAGVCGDARLASPALGERLAGHYAQCLAELIAETAGFPLERLAPVPPGSQP
mgnify:CR=1 FL=1